MGAWLDSTQLLAAVPATVTAAIIAAAVSVATTLVTKIWLESRTHRQDVETDYQYEQRRVLRELVGNYHGRLLDAATNWHYRMTNIYAYSAKGGLSVSGHFGLDNYYFNSTVYRFLALQATAQLFESEQIFVDARFVETRDEDLVKFVKALRWAASDSELFDGVPLGADSAAYDKAHGRDHFSDDRFRSICEAFLEGREQVPSFRVFETRIQGDWETGTCELQPVFEFFDGISPLEDRLRWDRLVCLHLLTISLVSRFGYSWLPVQVVDVENAVSQIKHKEVARNLAYTWLPRLGLAERSDHVEHEALDDVRLQLERRARDELAFQVRSSQTPGPATR
jgi:hypothetical protein